MKTVIVSLMFCLKSQWMVYGVVASEQPVGPPRPPRQRLPPASRLSKPPLSTQTIYLPSRPSLFPPQHSIVVELPSTQLPKNFQQNSGRQDQSCRQHPPAVYTTTSTSNLTSFTTPTPMPSEPRLRGGADRPRDRSRDRDRDRDRRGGTPHDHRRDRSRSPHHERGGRRSEKTRYRSRSPVHRSDRPRDIPRDVKDRDRERVGSRPHDRDARDPRAPPSGPRGRPAGNTARAVKPEAEETPDHKGEKDVAMGDAPPEGVDAETWEMIKVMGFGQFKSTKNTKVPGNDKNYGVRKDKVMTARQYMNRQGGFNRPLSPGR